jgi:cbb3-type cytochrome oxidase maturation protein
MDTLFLLIPVVLVLLAFAVAALMWAIRSGQFDDLEGPAYRILHDDDDPRIPFNRDRAEESPEDRGEGEAEHGDGDGTDKKGG